MLEQMKATSSVYNDATNFKCIKTACRRWLYLCCTLVALQVT